MKDFDEFEKNEETEEDIVSKLADKRSEQAKEDRIVKEIERRTGLGNFPRCLMTFIGACIIGCIVCDFCVMMLAGKYDDFQFVLKEDYPQLLIANGISTIINFVFIILYAIFANKLFYKLAIRGKAYLATSGNFLMGVIVFDTMLVTAISFKYNILLYVALVLTIISACFFIWYFVKSLKHFNEE